MKSDINPKENEILEHDEIIYQTLSTILKNMVTDFDEAGVNGRNKILNEIAAAFEGFCEKWGMPQKVYETYIKECVDERRLLTLPEYLEKTPKIVEDNPNLSEVITLFLLKIFEDSFRSSDDDD